MGGSGGPGCVCAVGAQGAQGWRWRLLALEAMRHVCVCVEGVVCGGGVGGGGNRGGMTFDGETSQSARLF